jgi:hypothetical protein
MAILRVEVAETEGTVIPVSDDSESTGTDKDGGKE